MNTLDARFGELRSLLAQRPSPRGWEALMGLLEALMQTPDGQAQVAERLPYLEAALDRWPDALRVATPAQLDVLERGEEPAVTWQLVRTLKLSGHARQQHQTRAILAHPATQAIPTLLLTTTPQPDEVWIEHVAPRVALRQLQLGFHAIQSQQLGVLLAAARWARLEALDLGWTQAALADAGEALEAGSALGALRTLSLEWSRLREADVEALASARLPALRALNLQYCRLDDTRAARLLGAMPLGALERLDLGHNALGEQAADALAALEAPALAELCVAGSELGAAQLMTILTSPARGELRRLDARGCVLTSQEGITLRAHASGITTLL